MAPSSTRGIDAPAGFVPFDLSDTAQSITSRFEKVARTWPDRLAVQSGGMSWTYAELDEAASRIAYDVRRAAPTAPQPVALLLGQGPRLLASILGILKAGHFYVPLDATHPRPAIARIIQDCGARLIVTDSARHPVAADVSASSAGPVPPVIVNADLARGHFKGIVSSVRVKPDALACIYYTSGTTGRPKGVMDTHRNVLHNVMRYTNGLGINPDDRLSLLQSPTFSGVMSSQFGALLNGAAVFPYDIQAEGLARIASWLLEERITIYHSVPAIFRHMLRAASGRQQFPDIRVVRLEGDGASLTDVALFNEHFARTSVLAHGLGATECGLVCRFVIGNGRAVTGGNVPVGHRVEDMRVRILDDQRSEVPAGEIGEIAVESRYLSPGYWKRPDLTRAAFTTGVMPGTRLYSTGDLGRMAPDGCVEHLGRKDGQAKVRGQRIDVEGVEAAIVSTKLVREAVVVVRPSSGGDARLTAYVVPNDGGLSTSSLRRQLTQLLPPQSVPSRFVCLPALPLTENHKLDRTALPGVTAVRPALEVPYVAPRTDLERTLASMWEVTLDIASIGVLDDFFDLGGDSLDAAAMLARFSATSGRTLPPAALFEAPTIERLARWIDGAAVEGVGGSSERAPRVAEQSPLVRVQPNGSRAPFFFLHAEYGGTGSYCANVARHLGENQPFFGLSPFGRDGGAVPSSIETMATAYLDVVRKEQPQGPYYLGGFCSAAVVAWEMAHQLGAMGQRVALLVLIEPPSLESGWTAHAIHRAARVAIHPAGGPDDRVQFLQRAMRLARLRSLPKRLATIRELPELIARSVRNDIPSTDRNAAIAATYRRAVDAYLPPPFAGPVLCLQAESENNARAAAAWRRVSSDYAVRRIPGDHNSCIITHARPLAAALASRLATIA